MEEYIDDNSDIDFSNNDSVTYDDIKLCNWNNKQEVPIKVIVNAFKNSYGDTDNTNKIVDHIMTLKLKRIDEISNALVRANLPLYEKKLWKANALEIFEHSELSNLLDDGNLQIFLVKEYIRLYSAALKRGLPMEDKNASKYNDTFLNARSVMMDLLKRTGKLNEANQILQMTLDHQPDTLSSYIDKEMKSVGEALASEFEELSPTKITKICRTLKDLIKDNYTKNYNDMKVKLKLSSSYQSTSNIEMNRIIGSMLSLNMGIILTKENQQKPKKEFSLASALREDTLTPNK